MRGLQEFPEETGVLKQLNAAHSELHLPPLIQDHHHTHNWSSGASVNMYITTVCVCALSFKGWFGFQLDWPFIVTIWIIYLSPNISVHFFEGRCPEEFYLFSWCKRDTLQFTLTHTHTHRESVASKGESAFPKGKFQQLFTGDWSRLWGQLVDTLDCAEETDSPILPRHCDR